MVTGASGGTWILHATSVADSAQTVGLQPFISSDVTLDAAASPGFVAPGTPILVSATLRRAGAALTGAAVTGVVAGSNGTTAPLVLVDDGTAGDLFAGDGVYSALFTPGGAGSYAARVVANGGAGPSYGGRQATTAIEAGPSVDVLIPNASLSAPSPWTYPSDPLAFSFRVRNDGALAADSVWVVAYDDSVGSAFLDTVIVIPAHDSIPLVATFRATQPGLHSLRFSATALGSVVDANPGNSLAMRGAEIVPFGGAPTLVSVDPPATKRFAPVYLATRSVPNPTRGATSLEFYLPRSAPRVVLRVLDVTGRQVTQSELGGFASGWQRAAWSPDRDAGGRVSPGVYLYRLECSGMVGQGRFVVVR